MSADAKITHEKAVHLSHVALKAVQGLPGISLAVPANDLRNRLLALIQDGLRLDAEIEARVRRKITSQKRAIPEGSAEWEVLQRRYYEEETATLRRR